MQYDVDKIAKKKSWNITDIQVIFLLKMKAVDEKADKIKYEDGGRCGDWWKGRKNQIWRLRLVGLSGEQSA